MKGLRQTIIFSAFIFCLLPLCLPSTAQATGCKSAASVTADIWDEWGKVIKVVGCAGVATASGGLSYSSCYETANKIDKAVQKMIAFWNKQAGNSWAKIGPRRLDFDVWHEGNIVGTTGRMFVSAYPSPNKRINVKVKKLDNKGKVEVVVCKVDSNNKYTKVASHVFQPGSDNIGKEWKVEIKGARDDVISIHIDGKSVAKSFKYKLRAKLIAEDSPPADPAQGASIEDKELNSAPAPAATVNR